MGCHIEDLLHTRIARWEMDHSFDGEGMAAKASARPGAVPKVHPGTRLDGEGASRASRPSPARAAGSKKPRLPPIRAPAADRNCRRQSRRTTLPSRRFRTVEPALQRAAPAGTPGRGAASCPATTGDVFAAEPRAGTGPFGTPRLPAWMPAGGPPRIRLKRILFWRLVGFMRESPSPVNGVRFRSLSPRSSWVRIPPPAPLQLGAE